MEARERDTLEHIRMCVCLIKSITCVGGAMCRQTGTSESSQAQHQTVHCRSSSMRSSFRIPRAALHIAMAGTHPSSSSARSTA